MKQYYGNENQVLMIFQCIMVLLLVVILGYSPILCFALTLILLTFGVGSSNSLIRIFLSICCIFSSAVVVGSRTYNIGMPSDDFSNYYYPRYIDITYGATIFDPAFAGGIEFLLPLLFKTISFLTKGDQSAVFLLFLNSLLTQFIFYLWIEKFGFKNIEKNKKSLCLAFCFIFFSILMPVQFYRQVYSSLFVLFSLSYIFDKNIIKTLLFLVIASLFHVSAIFIFLIFYMMMSENKNYHYSILIFCALLGFLSIPILSIISKYNLLGAATYKLNFYLGGGIDNLNANLGKLKFVILMLILKIFYFERSNLFSKYNNLINIAGISYILLVFIPVLPDRVMNLYIGIIFGYLFFLCTYNMQYILRIFLSIFIMYKIYNYIFDYDYNNMLQFSYAGLWYSYDWFGDEFFYYLKAF